MTSDFVGHTWYLELNLMRLLEGVSPPEMSRRHLYFLIYEGASPSEIAFVHLQNKRAWNIDKSFFPGEFKRHRTRNLRRDYD